MPLASGRLKGEVAVIGGGIAGLAAARRLTESGIEVVVLDKGRRPGGRMSTRQQHDRQFDHGAQYIRPHSRRSAVLFSKWRKAGLITPWHAQALELPQRKKVDTSSWHVGLPSQSALTDYLAKDLNVQCQFTALDISGEKDRWSIIGHKHQSAGPFKAVFVTCPAEQTALLMRPFPELHEIVSQASSRPCLATMVEFEEEVMVDFEAAFMEKSTLAWVCRDSAKPGRPNKECWVLQASEEFSRANLEDPPEVIASKMLHAFAPLSPVELPPVSFCRGHRWRYAFASQTIELKQPFFPEVGIGFAGDWLCSANVDEAYWSGVDLAEHYLRLKEK